MKPQLIQLVTTSHLKYKSHTHYRHKEVVLSNSTKDIKFIWLSSIEFIEYL